MADELPIEDTLAVEHHIVPFDWADVFQQGENDSIGERVALTRRHLSKSEGLTRLSRHGFCESRAYGQAIHAEIPLSRV